MIELDSKLLMVRDIDVQSPSARGATTLYKMRFTDLKTGLKVEERFKGDEQLNTIELQRRNVVLSYVDADENHNSIKYGYPADGIIGVGNLGTGRRQGVLYQLGGWRHLELRV